MKKPAVYIFSRLAIICGHSHSLNISTNHPHICFNLKITIYDNNEVTYKFRTYFKSILTIPTFQPLIKLIRIGQASVMLTFGLICHYYLQCKLRGDKIKIYVWEVGCENVSFCIMKKNNFSHHTKLSYCD